MALKAFGHDKTRPCMPSHCGLENGDAPLPRTFVTTHWSVVLSAKDGLAEQAGAALNKLCETYWFPLYVFVHRKGYDHHDASDLTQEFFNRLLARDFLSKVDRSKGKFRSYLLVTMKHFLAKEWHKTNAQKRGGNFTFVSMDAEELYLQIPASTEPPEQTYDREWYHLLLRKALDRLRDEKVAEGKAEFFERTKNFLTGDGQTAAYPQIAAELGMKTDAFEMAVSRLRKRWREVLREEIAHTVSRPEEVEEELRAMVAILSV